jgi:hypothetical protein
VIPDPFARLTALLGLPDAPDPDRPREQVHASLREVAGWLLIFDNADDVEDIASWIPAAPMPPGIPGHVLVTTRRGGFSALGSVLDLDLMQMAEAVALLRTRVPIIELEVAEAVAAELDRLPLALEQAAAFMDGVDPGAVNPELAVPAIAAAVGQRPRHIVLPYRLPGWQRCRQRRLRRRRAAHRAVASAADRHGRAGARPARRAAPPVPAIPPGELPPAGDWPAPNLAAGSLPGGPVMVSVGYRALPEREDELLAALQDARFSGRLPGQVPGEHGRTVTSQAGSWSSS